MKTVFIGDIHGRSNWKLIVHLEQPDRVVFIGDYFDSFDISGIEQIHNFKEIIDYKKTSLTGESIPNQKITEVIMLIGNHDYHYFPWIGYQNTSGYQSGLSMQIGQVLEENQNHLQMCYEMDGILCSHAGIGHDWLVYQNEYTQESGKISDFVNDLWKYKPKVFMFYGVDSYGDNTTQTPIWIRPKSLMSGNKKTFLKEQYIQIVGHTGFDRIDIKGKSTGGRYFFIDSLHVGQYLIHEDGVFSLGTI